MKQTACGMGDVQGPLPPQDGVASNFRRLSIKPSFPHRAASSPAASSEDSTSDSEHTRFLRNSTHGARSVAAHAFFSPLRDTTSGGKNTHGGFAPKTRCVHPVLATRYRWRMACANARQMDSPDVPFLSAMQHRGVAPLTYDSLVPSSSASLPRPSSLPTPSTEVVCELSSSTNTATILIRGARPPTRRRFDEHDTGLRTKRGRTERNTLMRLSPPALDASLPLRARSATFQNPLPGPLRCAKAHAPCIRRTSTPLS